MNVNQMSIIFLQAICASGKSDVTNHVVPSPSPRYISNSLRNKNNTLYTILKFIVRMLVFIEISTSNRTSRTIKSKNFITVNLVRCDPIMLPFKFIFCFIYLFYFRPGGGAWTGLIWLRTKIFRSGNINARGYMSDINEDTRQDNIKKKT